MIGIVRQLLATILSVVIAAPMFISTGHPVGNRKQITSTLAFMGAGLDCFR